MANPVSKLELVKHEQTEKFDVIKIAGNPVCLKFPLGTSEADMLSEIDQWNAMFVNRYQGKAFISKEIELSFDSVTGERWFKATLIGTQMVQECLSN